jgi:Cu(I)/Ag(I) efflux system membrane fusion protein
MKKFIYITLLAFLTACGGNKDKVKVEEKPIDPLATSKNSEVFNKSFADVLDAYFHLKDNFIVESDTMIELYAKRMMVYTDNLKVAELKGDAGIAENAKSFSQSISAELKGLFGEKDILKKRKSFNMLTDELYNLIRIVQYDQFVIYHQHTDNAFSDGDGNAYWLSKSADIKNPYTPKAMLTHGDIADSLAYKAK